METLRQKFFKAIEDVKAKTPERFWSKIKFGGISECWEWQAMKNDNGYGMFRVSAKVQRPAHRHLFICLFGDLNRYLQVCHSCDNPACVNPNHLWVGTNRDNVHDRDMKGRQARQNGTANGRAKLTEQNISEIKKMLRDGKMGKDIAVEFSVSTTQIARVNRNKAWKHLNKNS